MFLTNLLISIGTAFAERRRRERAYNELMGLSDHALADVGIARSQIRSLVYDEPPPERVAAPAATRQPSLARHRPA